MQIPIMSWAVVAVLMCLGRSDCFAGENADADPASQKTFSRHINFRTPLAECAIVFPSGMQNGEFEAARIRKAIREVTGLDAEMVSDRDVTSEDSWLIKEEYLSRPLIVLGNATDNRAVYALSTRMLTIANHRWPGKTKFCNRSVLEPFRRDVNCILLEPMTSYYRNLEDLQFKVVTRNTPEEEWLPADDPDKGWMKRSEVPVTAACLTENDKGITEVAVAFLDGFIRIYDIETGDVLRKFYTGEAKISRIMPMENGLVSVSADGVSLFDNNLKRVAYRHVQGNAAVRIGDRIFVGDESDGAVYAVDLNL